MKIPLLAPFIVLLGLLPASGSDAGCHYLMPRAACADGSVKSTCVKDGRNITCEQHTPEECAKPPRNLIACDTKQEFNNYPTPRAKD